MLPVRFSTAPVRCGRISVSTQPDRHPPLGAISRIDTTRTVDLPEPDFPQRFPRLRPRATSKVTSWPHGCRGRFTKKNHAATIDHIEVLDPENGSPPAQGAGAPRNQAGHGAQAVFAYSCFGVARRYRFDRPHVHQIARFHHNITDIGNF